MLHGYAPYPQTSYRDHNVVEASPHPMTSVPGHPGVSPSRRILAHLLAAIALLLEAGCLLLLAAAAQAGAAGLDSNTAGGFVLGATFPLVGWLIASRQPGNTIGWVFLGVGLSQALETFAGLYATVGLIAAPGSLPAADTMSWVATFAWAPAFGLLLTATVLLFPDGRPPSPRWRVVLAGAVVAVGMIAVPQAIMAWPSRGADLLSAEPSADQVGDPFTAAMLTLVIVGVLLLLVSSAASIAALLVRYRRSAGLLRAQLKWFVAAGIAEIGLIVGTSFIALPWTVLNVALATAAAPLLPVAAGIAILRYRLYDIDRIISRTLSYAIVTGLLAAVFAGLVVALQAALASVTGAGTLAVAMSTLAVFGLFQPLRRRVQRLVDHRFNRSKVDAEAALMELAAQLRDETDLDRVAGRVERAVRGALAPNVVALWTRPR